MSKPTYEELELEVFKNEDVIENLQEQLDAALNQVQEYRGILKQMITDIDELKDRYQCTEQERQRLLAENTELKKISSNVYWTKSL